MDRGNNGATGKSRRVGVEQDNTSTQSLKDTQAGVRVLARKEAASEDKDRIYSPEVSAGNVARNVACTIESRDAIEITDLYSVGHPHIKKPQLENGEAIPFIHRIELEGPKGELVRVRALFDDGAMVSAMCISIFKKIKHRLHNWSPSDRHLRMANGSIVKAVAKWTGVIRVEGVKARSTFEVFDSGGSWGFLFGKPTLKEFTAIHEYTTDTIMITDDCKTTQLDNQVADKQMLQRGDAVHLTIDEKQQGTEEARSNAKDRERPSDLPMGQWKPTRVYARREGTVRVQESVRGREKLPTSTSMNILTSQEEENPLLGELPEIEPRVDNPSIYTRQTNPFNPARIKEILRQIKFGDDLSEDKRKELEQLVADNADIFALALKEVVPIPGAALNLNVPENAVFNLRMHQHPLTPEQSKFYNERANDMLTAGIIERAPPELIRCTATTVIAQRVHETGGLPWEELKQRINDQH
jgi:hypothetical protein